MRVTYQKKIPMIAAEIFLNKAYQVEQFNSSSGKNYDVLCVENNIMSIVRRDAKSQKKVKLPLEEVYRAYSELEDFRTEKFRKYVSRKHSPARGLLIYLNMIEPK